MSNLDTWQLCTLLANRNFFSYSLQRNSVLSFLCCSFIIGRFVKCESGVRRRWSIPKHYTWQIESVVKIITSTKLDSLMLMACADEMGHLQHGDVIQNSDLT